MNRTAAYSTIGVAAFLFIVDQVLKRYFLANPAGGISYGFLEIGLYLNNGVWRNEAMATVGSAVVVLILLWLGSRYRYLWMLGVFLLGSVGNLLDRIVYGQVVDYFVFYELIFNVADVLIAVGAIGVVVQVVRRGNGEERISR
ncbi:MAG: signal peptidase II [Candidatus Andersenbacteria bacterium]